MTTPKPLVSVVMPVYNGAATIAQAVESVFRQNVSLELLVIDDGSTDQTAEILSAYQNRPNFYYLKNQHNIGAAASRNRGVQTARGQYIAYLDADDWWEDDKLEIQLEALQKTGRILCSSGRELMNPDGTPTGKYIPIKEIVSYRELLKHNSINCSSVLLARNIAAEFPMEHDDSHEACCRHQPTTPQISHEQRQQIRKQKKVSRYDLQSISLYGIQSSAMFSVFYFLCHSRILEIPLILHYFTERTP